MINIVENFKDRFNKALSLRNMRPVELKEKTGISESALSQYRSGYAKPKQDKLYLIANALNVNPTWLMGLDVPMETTTNGHGDVEIIGTTSLHYSEEEQKARDLFELYQKANPDVQQAVELILKSSQQNT